MPTPPVNPRKTGRPFKDRKGEDNTGPLRVLVTGAGTQLGYHLACRLAEGLVFGSDQKVHLILYDAARMEGMMKTTERELLESAPVPLNGVEVTSSEKAAFTNIDYAFLLQGAPMQDQMEWKDFLIANVRIFKSQGKALAKHSKATTKVLVLAEPINTNTLIVAKYADPKVSAKNISGVIRLDHIHATAKVARKAEVTTEDVTNVVIWGNHSSTQFPDLSHAKIHKDGGWVPAHSVVDDEWFKREFITEHQNRAAVRVPSQQERPPAHSMAKAAGDHAHDIFAGTSGKWVSMVVQSEGSYGVPKGLMFSFPVTIENRNWTVVKRLEMDAFAKEQIEANKKESKEDEEGTEDLKSQDSKENKVGAKSAMKDVSTMTVQPTKKSSNKGPGRKLSSKRKKKKGASEEEKKDNKGKKASTPSDNPPSIETRAYTNNSNPLVTVEPEGIRWTKTAIAAKLKVENISGERLVVKAKCSDIISYRINPVFSFLEISETIEWSVERVAMPTKPGRMVLMVAKCKTEDIDCVETMKGTPVTKQVRVNLPMSHCD